MAVDRAFRKLKQTQRPDRRLVPKIAENLSAWKGTSEPVVMRLVPKEDDENEARPVLDFGVENRALQYIILSVLEARANLHSSQYLMRGVPKAIRRVAELLMEDNCWVIETDIRKCYSSFDGTKVGDYLPLPKEVTLRSLISESLSIKIDAEWTFGTAEWDEELHSSYLADVRRGFPQGSAASSLAVELLLAPAYFQLPKEAVSVGYADNFLAIAGDHQGACSTTEAFWSALTAHPAGQLRPKEPKMFEPGEPITFLGHLIQAKSGTVQISPSPKNLAKFEQRMHFGISAIRDATSDKSRQRRAKDLRTLIRSWTSTFQACDGILDRRAIELSRVENVAGVDVPCN